MSILWGREAAVSFLTQLQNREGTRSDAGLASSPPPAPPLRTAPAGSTGKPPVWGQHARARMQVTATVPRTRASVGGSPTPPDGTQRGLGVGGVRDPRTDSQARLGHRAVCNTWASGMLP